MLTFLMILSAQGLTWLVAACKRYFSPSISYFKEMREWALQIYWEMNKIVFLNQIFQVYSYTTSLSLYYIILAL